jgi:RNA polymerase sigma-70 factor (ECF subfamily)
VNDIITRAACEHALRRIAQGDMDGLETIYDKLGRRIYLLAYSILGDSHAAEDVMQDTLIKISESSPTLRRDSNAVAYILTVTRNLSIDRLRKRQREFPLEAPCFDASSSGEDIPDIPFSALEALSLLDEEERQIVTLKIEGGLKHREIAPMLGISQAACEKRYRRALEKLKSYYLT